MGSPLQPINPNQANMHLPKKPTSKKKKDYTALLQESRSLKIVIDSKVKANEVPGEKSNKIHKVAQESLMNQLSSDIKIDLKNSIDSKNNLFIVTFDKHGNAHVSPANQLNLNKMKDRKIIIVDRNLGKGWANIEMMSHKFENKIITFEETVHKKMHEEIKNEFKNYKIHYLEDHEWRAIIKFLDENLQINSNQNNETDEKEESNFEMHEQANQFNEINTSDDRKIQKSGEYFLKDENRKVNSQRDFQEQEHSIIKERNKKAHNKKLELESKRKREKVKVQEEKWEKMKEDKSLRDKKIDLSKNIDK